MAVPEQVAAYVAKSRIREPEMAFAEVFCPRPLRIRFALWGALLFELREAAFELSDARPTEVKSAWWADELLRSAQNTPRHPLMQALAAPQLPWNALARGLLAVTQIEVQRPSDRDAALAAVAPLAGGIATVEAMLFDAKQTQAASRAIAVHLLGERLRVGLGTPDGGRVPLALLARHGITSAGLSQPQGMPAVADWAAELAAASPSDMAGAPLYRRTRAAFDTWFLRELAADRASGRLPSFRALQLAWRAARQPSG